MDMNPQLVRNAEFKSAKRGLDPVEVQTFLHAVADELERAQNQATAMEARARAAVARLQELSADSGTDTGRAASVKPDTAPAVPVSASAPQPAEVQPTADQTETISRTLILAQRTADTTVAEARAEAEQLLAEARSEAEQQIATARVDAHKVGEEERGVIQGEFNALLARRDFLESDVDHLEQFLVEQRSRLREAATEIVDITERVPGGLGAARRPLLSASASASEADHAADDDEIVDDEVAAHDAPAHEGSDGLDETAAMEIVDGNRSEDRRVDPTSADVGRNRSGSTGD